MIKVIFDRRFISPRYKDKFFDPCGLCLLHGVLDKGLINDRQHFFGQSFRRGQKPRAKAANGEDRFANFLHEHSH